MSPWQQRMPFFAKLSPYEPSGRKDAFWDSWEHIFNGRTWSGPQRWQFIAKRTIQWSITPKDENGIARKKYSTKNPYAAYVCISASRVHSRILPEFLLMKMEPFARTGKPVMRILSISPRKVSNSISSERNLLQYWRPTTCLLQRAKDDAALVGTGRVIYCSHSRGVAVAQDLGSSSLVRLLSRPWWHGQYIHRRG